MASNTVSNHGLAATLDCDRHENTICLFIRFTAHTSYAVDVSVDVSVRDLKVAVAEKAGLSADSINLVLAGQKLQDTDLLKSYGIGSHTVLHAFCLTDQRAATGDARRSDTGVKTLHPVSDPSATNGRRERKDLEITDDLHNLHGGLDSELGNRGQHNLERSTGDSTPQTRHSPNNALNRLQGYYRFFVYCKLCDGIRPAKLRLVCAGCGNGAFLVDRGPANWDDISTSTTISGQCTSKQCQCTQPKFYLRCCERHEGDVDGTAVVLKHINTNRRRVECIACGDIASHVLIFPCGPGHVTCLNCFRQYSSVCLNERRFTEHERHGYTLPCPAGCQDSYIEETHHFLLMGKENYERYKNFGAEEFVLQNGGVLCPAPGCGMGLFPEDDETRLVKCGECQFESCKDCRAEYHTGSCGQMEHLASSHAIDMGITDEMAERACWEQQSLSLIEETTKQCPNCQIKTERSGGCMHMVCSRCECEWCWICVQPWTRDCMAQHWFG
ncbi:E3 ubiquitin-protein ligase parkin [Plakobranchus ocellatus]|uniref:E3 ubiquitin-protein ligase parkin n=1 Tax=Plakobranchus ocellatus TaxID=259542 RepID=A0AAV4DTD7_9GAST|nr:E3 ubiquitin-protein ligase parkin [Plakobranchus ocellatus]